MSLSRLWEYRKWIGYGILFVAFIILLSQAKITWKDTVRETGSDGNISVTGEEISGLPEDHQFRQVAENERLRLKFHDRTGHFIVEDKLNGNLWRSFPDPDKWDNVGIDGGWLNHLQSTMIFQYMDFTNVNATPKESNTIKEIGRVTDIREFEQGIEFKLDLQKVGFIIPIRITIQDDYVETAIIDEGIEEYGKESLIWLRLYPFFSASQSDEEGYLFIPDGSGALISFQEKRSSIKQLYHERIYGADLSFISSPSSRHPILMPVFGMKVGNKAFLAVVDEGATYTDVVASPAGVYSNYNWIGTQQNYRMRYLQVTNEAAGRSFETYTKDSRFGTDRVTRYYLLGEEEADYVGMASVYRRYLMEKYGLERIQPKHDDIPLYVSLLGADREQGFITDRYVKATATSDAIEIVQELYGLGIENMVINYAGWQKDGLSSFGGYRDVDKRLGGNKGMRNFVEYANSLDIPVYLEVDYTINNTEATGFKPRIHGVRNLAGTILSYPHFSGDSITLASRQYMLNALKKDLAAYKKLGVQGLFLAGVGTNLVTDYNTKYGGSREETIRYDQEVLQLVKDTLGAVQVHNPGFYTLGQVNHIYYLADDYSYDLFSAKAIPFAQIALHGLITYSSAPENDRSEYNRDFLRDIEYGSYPSFDFTMVKSEELSGVYTYAPKSSTFSDWKVEAIEQYQRYNDVLGDVQDQFIVGHRELASGVMETEYENGKKVIVNYNRTPYQQGGIYVPAMDYMVIEWGEGR